MLTWSANIYLLQLIWQFYILYFFAPGNAKIVADKANIEAVKGKCIISILQMNPIVNREIVKMLKVSPAES